MTTTYVRRWPSRWQEYPVILTITQSASPARRSPNLTYLPRILPALKSRLIGRQSRQVDPWDAIPKFGDRSSRLPVARELEHHPVFVRREAFWPAACGGRRTSQKCRRWKLRRRNLRHLATYHVRLVAGSALSALQDIARIFRVDGAPA
jgi:hypothetical protein